jgi:hypothetical protein
MWSEINIATHIIHIGTIDAVLDRAAVPHRAAAPSPNGRGSIDRKATGFVPAQVTPRT